MRLEIYTANCTGNEKNTLYPMHVVSEDAASFKEAISHDHVCGSFLNNRRGIDNFQSSSLVVMDCDNDHSEDPSEWIYPEDISEMMPDVAYAIATSRHHMLSKGGKAARPRFHVYFPIEETCDAEQYADLKKGIYAEHPFFDDGAIDAARFIYGSDAEVIWHDGWVYIDELIGPIKEPDDEYHGGVIKEGCRNSTLSAFAAKVLIRYGVTEKAHEIFLEHAAKCDPPLESDELASIWKSAVKFAKKATADGSYVPPEEYNQDFKSLKPDDYSDIGQARAFLRLYGDEICYNNATDFLRYIDGVWVESGQKAMGIMEEFLDLQLQEAKDEMDEALKAVLDMGENETDVVGGTKKYVSSLSGDVLKAFLRFKSAQTYHAFVMKRRDVRYITSALTAAKPMVELDVTELDRNEFYLNVPGATYDLRKGMAGRMEPNPKNYITKQTIVAPGDKGKDIWEDALNTFFCNDDELKTYVQKIMGLAAIGKVYVEALIIAYGSGRNCKSTCMNTIARVLGTYSGGLSSDALTFTCKRNIKPEMAELRGRRLVIAAELEEGMRLNSSVVKQICSTDDVIGEKKYMAPFHFTPSHTVVLYTNHLPKVGANDEGIWRRLIVIPFKAKIEGESDIKNYSDYLVENAGPAIMNWIIEGARMAIEDQFRFEMPSCVKEAVDSYRCENDWMGRFLDECCVIEKSATEKSGDLYIMYRNFCQRNGEYTRSTTDFYAALEREGFTKRKTMKGAFVYGLRLKVDDFLE